MSCKSITSQLDVWHIIYSRRMTFGICIRHCFGHCRSLAAWHSIVNLCQTFLDTKTTRINYENILFVLFSNPKPHCLIRALRFSCLVQKASDMGKAMFDLFIRTCMTLSQNVIRLFAIFHNCVSMLSALLSAVFFLADQGITKTIGNCIE